jgi:arylsulfatase A-like enzyme
VLLSSKTLLIFTQSKYAAHAAWQAPFAWSQDALLALALTGLLALTRGHVLAYAAGACVVFANTLLTVVAKQVRAYYSPADPMPESGQWLQVLEDYLDVSSALLIVLSAVALIGLPRWLERRAPLLATPFTSARATAILGVYCGLGLLAFLPANLSAFRVHRNPVAYFGAEMIAPTQLVSDGTQGATLDTLTAELAGVSPQPDARPLITRAEREALPASNLLLIVMESVGQRALRPLPDGSSNHPFLESIATRALQFDAHHSPAPHSASALEKIHCGRFRPPRLPNGHMLNTCVPFPARLSRAGVATAFFQSSFFGDWIPEAFFRALGYAETYDSSAIAARAQEAGAPIKLLRNIAQEHDSASAVLDWSRGQCAAGRPFFATWYTWVAHSPYPADHAGGHVVEKDAPSELRYRQLVRVVDHEIGQLYAALSTMSCDGRPFTLVVTGDHGEAFLEHPGNLYHSAYPYQENLHVPLLMVLPSGFSRRTNLPTSHVDLARSLLALSLGPAEGQRVSDTTPALDGRSLLDATRVKPIFGYSLLGDGILAARFGPHKVIKSRDVTVLFDLSVDPEERIDLSAERPELQAALSSAVDRFVVGARP